MIELQLLLATFSAWANRRQGNVIAYLIEENRVTPALPHSDLSSLAPRGAYIKRCKAIRFSDTPGRCRIRRLLLR